MPSIVKKKGRWKMYKYTYRTRGLSIGCQPSDFVKFEQENHKFETIFYARKLTKEEIDEYELIDLSKTHEKHSSKEKTISKTPDHKNIKELEEIKKPSFSIDQLTKKSKEAKETNIKENVINKDSKKMLT